MEYQFVFDELRKESDRACAVLSRGILETHLKVLLEKFLIKDLSKSFQKDLFEGNGALSSFSSRIKMCYSLGLIGKLERDALNSIRLISNKFAHSVELGLSFDDNKIVATIQSIELFQLLWKAQRTSDIKDRYNSNRKKFEYVLGFITAGLLERIKKIERLDEAKMVFPPFF